MCVLFYIIKLLIIFNKKRVLFLIKIKIHLKMKTNDNLKLEKTERNESTQKIPEEYVQTKIKKFKIFNIILISLNILFLIGICLLIFFLLKSKKQEREKVISSGEELSSNDESKNNNEIIGTYSVKSGQKFQLFKPEKINIKEGDYYIESLEKSNNLRNLKIINDENGYYTSNESGEQSFKIIFKVVLNSLNEIFKDNQELIKVDLSELNMEKVLSMNSSFSGCQNLEEVNLEGIDTSNLLDMAYTFEKCNNLKNLDLSPIKTNKTLNTKGIFSECDKLESINISSFEKVEENMFEGIKSMPNIISNQYASISISNIFQYLFNININITIVESTKKFNKTEKCIIGEKEKCKECNRALPGNCLTCNKGYYLPLNEIDNKICLPCEKIENCQTCFGDKYHILCSSCDSSFYLENNMCIKKQKKVKCIIGEKEKCKSCKEEEDLIDECQTCNEGYYLSENTNKSECLNCDIIENCLDCKEVNNNVKCKKCPNGYEILDNSCIERDCSIGKNEKCSSCKIEKGRKRECKTCNEGYFLSEENQTICSKCTIKNCKQCSFKDRKEVCDECKDTFISIKDENGNIESCQCDYGFNAKNGTCEKEGNWIKVWLDVDYSYNNGYCTILYNYYSGIKQNEIEVYINGTKTEVSVSNRITYTFSKGGIYVLDINIKKTLTSMEWMFNSDYIFSVTFMPGFDCSKVTSMEYMFVNSNIESIDMKHLDISNVKNFKFFIHENDYVKRYEKLKEYIIDLSSFDTSHITICSGMIHDISEDVIIKISNKFTKCREQISLANKVINVDEIDCQKFENCEKCVGSKESLKCNKCKSGYLLNEDNYCIKPKCIVGEKEKCLNCNIEMGKENECLKCNEGYYLDLNSNDKTKCKKCQIDGCKLCNNSEGICDICKNNYEPLINYGKIIDCKIICDLGKDGKCKTCNLEEKNKCGSCNPGYKLMKNGKCIKIENSFTASYNVKSLTKPTYIMNLMQNNINLSNIEMYVDNKRVYPYLTYDSPYKIYKKQQLVSYKFEKLGINNVKIIINQTLIKMQNLFYQCEDLLNIVFSESFDTSNVQCMQYLFGSCRSLTSIDISSFNTSSVNDYTYMFNGCEKLTSLNLSNFEGKYSCGFNLMFISLTNLKYIDIFSLYSIYPECNRLNLLNVPYNGIIIANRNFTNINSNNWEVRYKD